jgi:hypothetical protein
MDINRSIEKNRQSNEHLDSSYFDDSISTFKRNRSHTQRLMYPRPKKESEDIPSWEKLNFSDKAKLFSYWVVAINVACILVFVG